MKVSVSILSSSIKASDIVKKLDNTMADYIHLDIMDGKFVDNKTWTFSEVKKYIEDYAMLNTSYITFHYEAVKDIDEMIEFVKDYGLKVGIAINPDTNESVLFPYLNKIDEIIVMSVFPGRSGQTFIENTTNKIRNLKEEIIKQNSRCIISVDGGINNETGFLCKEAGVDMLVSATYIHNNIPENIRILKKL